MLGAESAAFPAVQVAATLRQATWAAQLDDHGLCQCRQSQGLSGCADYLLRQRGLILLAGSGEITASPEQADLVVSCRTALLRSQNWLNT